MKNLINFFAIALLFFVTSCQKEEIQYSENPYANIGEEHNRILQDFFTTYENDLIAIQSPIEKEAFIFNKIMEMEGGNPNHLFDAKNQLGIQASSPLASYDFTRTEDFFTRIQMGEEAKQLLVNELETMMTMDVTTDLGLKEIQSAIRNVEIEFFKNYEDTNDFEPAMIYLAVLKSTANFWNTNQEKKASGAKWWQVLLADTAGAVVGAGVTIATGGTGAAAGIAISAAFSAAVSKNP